AAAMRSVVAEQIEALNELNAIVSAQPKSHDVSRASFAEPRRDPAPAPRAAEPAPRPAPAPQASPEPAQQRGYDEDFLATLNRPASAPQAQPQRPQPEPAPAPAARDENGGWLKDVLRNASANQQQSAPAPETDRLSGLTAEIAQSVD